MATTLLGDALMLVIGNHDFLKVCAVFTLSVSLLFAAVYSWKHIELWREE